MAWQNELASIPCYQWTVRECFIFVQLSWLCIDQKKLETSCLRENGIVLKFIDVMRVVFLREETHLYEINRRLHHPNTCPSITKADCLLDWNRQGLPMDSVDKRLLVHQLGRYSQSNHQWAILERLNKERYSLLRLKQIELIGYVPLHPH